MLTIREFVKVQSLEEAYELNQKKSNRVIGGMLWMKMGDFHIQKAIDLSGLGLDSIEETEEEFSIGCMVTLRDLENHPGLDAYTQGAVKESLRHIVGVQFRNLATVGGSIFGRFGFSDVLTLFMAMDSYVELYRGGLVSLKEFAGRKRDSDILVRLVVKKIPLSCAYLSQRLTRTDFPVLALAVSRLAGEWRAVVGARPGRAILIRDEKGLLKEELTGETIRQFADYVKEETPTGKNMRAGAEYRSHLVKVLTKRACEQIGGTEHAD